MRSWHLTSREAYWRTGGRWRGWGWGGRSGALYSKPEVIYLHSSSPYGLHFPLWPQEAPPKTFLFWCEIVSSSAEPFLSRVSSLGARSWLCISLYSSSQAPCGCSPGRPWDEAEKAVLRALQTHLIVCAQDDRSKNSQGWGLV